MIFILTFKPDEIYYREAYGEMISSLKFKKYEPMVATVVIIFGIVLYFMDDNNKLGIFPFVFSGLGIYDFYKSYYDKKKWLKDRLDSKIIGQPIEMEFNDTSIKQTGPFTNGELQWTGLKNIIKTKKGILIKPENGISMYLPDGLFTNKEQIEFILSKKQHITAG